MLGGAVLLCAGLIETVSAALKDTEKIPEIFIRAVNPGYTIDGKSNVGEMIEIVRKNSDTPGLLAGITVRYTTSSGKSTDLYDFPENSYIAGESILLRLASSPDSELAAINYTKTLAMSGSLELIKDENVIDRLCWTGKEDCYKNFSSAKPSTLVRNLETGEFEFIEDYQPVFLKEAYKVESVAHEEESEKQVPKQCRGLIFSEVLSYYDELKTEQFIELYNSGAEQILMDGCQLRYRNKKYMLNGVVKPDGYFAYFPVEFSLTKNPTNSNTIELLDTDDEVIDKLVYYNGQRKATAFALIGYDSSGDEIWKTTYAPTPGGPNVFQEFRTCEAGKVLNEATGNCVKVTAITEKICPEGQYLNILTGRCKKYEKTSEKKCKQGQYLNEETGRGRKIVQNKGADYAISPDQYESKTSFVALYGIVGVIVVGILLVGYEFRNKLSKAFRRVFRRQTLVICGRELR